MNKILKIYFIALCLINVSCVSSDTNKPFRFAAIADCQYCQVERSGIRYYSLSKDKLTKCVTELNKLSDLKYAVHLGDFIDRDFKSFDVVVPIYNKLNAKHYHVLGNHDYSVADDKKKDVVAKLGMPSSYYDFEQNSWKFIVLDGNDISFHKYPKSSKEFKEAKAYYKKNKIKSPSWNGAIGKKQMQWLEQKLKKAEADNQSVVLYCHFPVYPKNGHNLWNAKEVVTLIEKYTCVKAYINGHNHHGNYALKNNVHYLTLKGMVDTKESSYAVISVSETALKVKGYGREKDRILKIKEKQ